MKKLGDEGGGRVRWERENEWEGERERERELVAVGKKECRKKKVCGIERVNGLKWESGQWERNRVELNG